MIAREQFLAAVRSCIGTPVGHNGRTIGGALDCVGVPWAACVACGMAMEPTPQYRRRLPSADELAAGLSVYCDRVGDLARAHLLQVFAGREARHVVVPVRTEGDRLYVVHAWGKGGVVQETALRDRVAQGWRVRGVE